MRRSKWPGRLAIGAAVIGATVGWLLVSRAVQRSEAIGFVPGPEFGLVVFLALAAGLATWAIARRLLDGPTLTRTGWSLGFAGPISARVSDLRSALERRGYSLSVDELDDATLPLHAAPPEKSIAGAQLGLASHRPGEGRARVVLRLSAPHAAGEPGIGLVESEDTSAGFYDELGQYLIAALAELVPGITYKRADSALDAEPAESLRALLPPRPSRLDEKTT